MQIKKQDIRIDCYQNKANDSAEYYEEHLKSWVHAVQLLLYVQILIILSKLYIMQTYVKIDYQRYDSFNFVIKLNASISVSLKFFIIPWIY